MYYHPTDPPPCPDCGQFPCDCPVIVLPNDEYDALEPKAGTPASEHQYQKQEPKGRDTSNIFKPRLIPGTTYMWRTKPYKRPVRLAIVHCRAEGALGTTHGPLVRKFVSQLSGKPSKPEREGESTP